jgi:hypothetical protein
MVYTETQNDKQLSYHDIISNVEKNDIHMNIITNDTLKTKEEF